VVRGEIVAELKTLEWEKFKGRGSKSQLQVIIPQDSALHDLRVLFNDRMDGWWRRLQFIGKDADPIFEVEFLKGDYSVGYAWRVRVAIDSLRLLGIVPPVLNGKLKRAARKVVDEAGLSPEELEAAIAAFKGKA
ncbi:MAG: hypothetical protein ACTSX8_01405, partial [Alphaproteobacteria bacterium]